jgi:hypothetical protein
MVKLVRQMDDVMPMKGVPSGRRKGNVFAPTTTWNNTVRDRVPRQSYNKSWSTQKMGVKTLILDVLFGPD